MRRMAIGCPTRRLLNVTVLRDIVEPKPSAGTQQQSLHLQSARHPRGGEHDRPDNFRGPTRRHRARPRRSRQAARAICGATTRGLLARLPKDLHWSEEPANFTVVPQAVRAWRSPPACCRRRSAWTRGCLVATPLRCARSRDMQPHQPPQRVSARHLARPRRAHGVNGPWAMVGHSVHHPTKSSETIECPLSAKSLRSLTPAIPFQRSPYAHNMLILLGSALDEPLSGLVGSPT